MSVRRFSCALSVLLVAVWMTACTAKPIDHSLISTSSVVSSGSITDQPSDTTVVSDESTVAETKTQETTSTTHAASVSSENISVAASSTTTFPSTVAPTIHMLTPLAESSYYGLSQFKGMPNEKELTALYQKLVIAVTTGQTEIFLQGTLTENEVFTAFYYYRADYPQHFWLDGGLKYIVSKTGNKVTKIILNYTMTGEVLALAQVKFGNAVLDLLKIAATGSDEYERERLLHDALAKKITYKDGKNAHNAYGALVEGEAVCEGYARAFQYVLYQAGIQCLIAEGSSTNPTTGQTEGHAWNVVRIDGSYYHVDLTWDDTDNTENPVMYSYFNMTTAQIVEGHTIRFEECYALPNCIATAANYHVKNGTRITEYTVNTISALLKGKTEGVHLYCVDGAESFMEWYHANHQGVARALRITGGYSYQMLCVGKEVLVIVRPQVL